MRATRGTGWAKRAGGTIKNAIVLFTRDLRCTITAHAATGEQADLVVPLSGVDARLMSATPNRARFLLESLADVRAGLRARGGDLAVRHGRPEAAVIRLATQTGAREMQWRRPLVGPDAARLPGGPGSRADAGRSVVRHVGIGGVRARQTAEQEPGLIEAEPGEPRLGLDQGNAGLGHSGDAAHS